MNKPTLSIDWSVVRLARLEEAATFGAHAEKLALAGDALMAGYYAMQAAHFVFLAFPELGIE